MTLALSKRESKKIDFISLFLVLFHIMNAMSGQKSLFTRPTSSPSQRESMTFLDDLP